MSMVSYRVFSYVGNVDACKGCMHTSVDQLDLHKILHIFKDKKCQIQYINSIMLYFDIVLYVAL